MKYILAIITACLISGCDVNVNSDDNSTDNSDDNSVSANDNSSAEKEEAVNEPVVSAIAWQDMTEEEQAIELERIDAGYYE